MEINQWLDDAVRKLNSVEIASARLDALILLEDELTKDRSWILANPEHKLTSQQIKTLDAALKRRANFEPLAYIRGKSEFFSREFIVTSATLQPRPETETMIELLLDQVVAYNLDALNIADIGTGSGAIAITISLELPEANVFATEINNDALNVAKQNAKNLAANVEFHRGDLLEPISDKSIDIIVANLPYVPDSYTINEAAMQEPKIAIFGGEDGLDLYRQMFSQIDEREQKPKFILTESLPFQHEALAGIAKACGYNLSRTADLIQVFEV